MDPIKIDSDRLLLCEGKTTLLVLGPLCRSFEIQGFQPINFGSKDDFRSFLEDIKVLPGFADRVRSIAVVRDAETDPDATFRSARDSLLAAGLPAPEAPGSLTVNQPRVGLFLVPDNASPGMIETLCMRSIASDPAVECVEQFFACIETRLRDGPSNMHKAQAQAFLATRPQLDYHV